MGIIGVESPSALVSPFRFLNEGNAANREPFFFGGSDLGWEI